MPAHFCGVAEIEKTTVGQVSRASAMPLSHSLDTVGPLARTAEDCALLLGLMAGADPVDATASGEPVADYLAATREPIKGLTIGIPSAFYVDDLDSEVARVLEEIMAILKAEGVRVVQVDLPDQRQLVAACQLVLAVEATAFHKRWMIERPQDYGPQVLMRLQNEARHTGAGVLIWKRCALARTGAGGACCGDVQRRCGAGAGGSDSCAYRCRKRRRQWSGRRSGDPAAYSVYPTGQLSRPAVARDPIRLHQGRLAGRHAVDWPFVRRSHAVADWCGVPAGDRFS